MSIQARTKNDDFPLSWKAVDQRSFEDGASKDVKDIINWLKKLKMQYEYVIENSGESIHTGPLEIDKYEVDNYRIYLKVKSGKDYRYILIQQDVDRDIVFDFLAHFPKEIKA